MASERVTAAERLAAKHELALVVTEGGQQLRFWMPDGSEVVATWLVKSGRPALASGVRFRLGHSAQKVTSRQLTELLATGTARAQRPGQPGGWAGP